MDKTMVELFAGVGGFRVALEKVGFKTVWANQWEPSTTIQHAFEVYTANFGSKNAVNKDINEVDKASIPNHTLLVGGFPCQDYSVARTKAKGIHGKKGVLWWSISETIEVKKPKFVLLENVDRLIKSPTNQRGRDFGVMLRVLCDLGYSLEWRVINAADYGFPQRRRRVFMFAAHHSTEYYQRIKQVKHADLLSQSGFFSTEFPAIASDSSKPTESISEITTHIYKDLVNVSNDFNQRFYNSGIMFEGHITTKEMVPIKKEPIKLGTMLIPNPDESLFIEDCHIINRFKTLKGAKKEKRVNPDGYEYNYSEGGMVFPDPLDRPARTLLTSESSINRSTHVIEDPVRKKYRLLSPQECERLNGFKIDWTNPKKCKINITNKRRYFFMGNALVVGVVKKMGKQVARIIDEEK